MTNLLLDAGANVNAGDKNGFTALHVASQEGHFNIVKLLIEKGAEVNIKNGIGAHHYIMPYLKVILKSYNSY